MVEQTEVEVDAPILREVEPYELGDLADPSAVLEVMRTSVEGLLTAFVARIPLFVVALAVLLVSLLLIRLATHLVDRGLGRARLDVAVRRLVMILSRVGLVTAAVLVALSIAGVEVGAAPAAIGLAGLALAFALQNILEDSVAGVVILMRKAFLRGEQLVTNGHAGTVEDGELRVTRIRDVDGELVLVPNADVFTHPSVNLTRLGIRRTRVTIGIDYRDDHAAARAVLLEAVRRAPGVAAEPPPEVLVSELGESSVDFEVAVWSAPDLSSVRRVRDEVLRACKSAVEAAGMTIPWPIGTLAADRHPLQVHHDGEVAGSCAGR